MHRVKISLVISGNKRVEPHIQPPGYDEDEPTFLWLKSQMRLMMGGHHTDTIDAQLEEPNEDDDLDDDEIQADEFVNTSFGDGGFMPPIEGAYQHDEEARDPADPSAKPSCSTRLFTASQEMSPAACTF